MTTINQVRSISLVLDLGNFRSKYAYKHNGVEKVGSVSSVIKDYYERTISSKLNIDELTVANRRYYMGEDTVKLYSDESEAFYGTKSKANQEVFLRALYVLALIALNEKVSSFNVTFQAPYISLKSDYKFFKENFAGKVFNYNLNGSPLSIRINEVEVMPEGFGSYLLSPVSKGLCRVLDFGSKTINVITFRDGIPIEDECDTIISGLLDNSPRSQAMKVIKRMYFIDLNDYLIVTGGMAEEMTEEFRRLGYIKATRVNCIKGSFLANALGLLSIVQEVR